LTCSAGRGPEQKPVATRAVVVRLGGRGSSGTYALSKPPTIVSRVRVA